MRLKNLSILNFKNIAHEELALCPGINCLVGGNGAGKTNIIDAVYYLSMCKSSLQMTDGQSIRHGEEFFMIDGQYRSDEDKNENVSCSYSRRGGKILKRNGKEYDRLSDHVGLIPAVIVSPADTALISDTAEERRRYLNAFLSQLDRTYLNAMMRYNAILTERNRLLKMHPDPMMLSIYDMQLIDYGTLIHDRRSRLTERLRPLVASFYRTLSNDREQVELVYKSELNDRPFGEILAAARQKDMINEFTTSGIHRDDLTLRIGGYPLRKYGSQGQQKSFLIALKLAQYAIISEKRHERPILLLDDLFDKLDISRVEQLIHLVRGDAFGQIFITDCNTTRLRSILDRSGDEYALFTVGDGTIGSCHTVTGGNTSETTAAEDLTTEGNITGNAPAEGISSLPRETSPAKDASAVASGDAPRANHLSAEEPAASLTPSPCEITSPPTTTGDLFASAGEEYDEPF